MGLSLEAQAVVGFFGSLLGILALLKVFFYTAHLPRERILVLRNLLDELDHRYDIPYVVTLHIDQ
jgi:hypothetical protein